MKPTHIEHIGIAVKSLEQAIPLFEKLLGSSCYGIEEVKDQKVKTAFFRIGEVKIELLESTGPDGPIARHIEKRGEGLHHLAIAVDDVAGALKSATDLGLQLIDQTPRTGAEHLQIGFVHPRSTHGVLLEFSGTK